MIVLIVIIVLVFTGFVTAVVFDVVEKSKEDKRSQKRKKEFSALLEKFQSNAYVREWASEAVEFFREEANANKYERKDFDICCCKEKIVFINNVEETTLFVHYFAEYNMEDLPVDYCDALARAMANIICEQTKGNGIQVEIDENTDHKYIDEDFEEEQMAVITLEYKGLKGTNKW